MARDHPVDAAGRALPEPAWPPGRHAPDGLEFVRRFCNTANLESGADRLADAGDFDRWLLNHGHDAIQATDHERARLVEIRETLRAAAVTHAGAMSDDAVMNQLQDHWRAVRFRFSRRDGSIPIAVDAPAGSTEHVVATLAIHVVEAISADTWQRLKACSNCRWVVYDSSKNQSSRWCSMSACGGRSKVRRHRARRHSGAAG